MLHQPLRGLDSFATRLRRSTKLPQMQALGAKTTHEVFIDIHIVSTLYGTGQ